MEHDSWKRVVFSYPDEIPTMISHEEKQYLYWLGQSVWGGVGAVVEIGPWLGGSTACLAAGMQVSGHNGRQQLHTCDNFIWRDFMAVRTLLPIQAGASFYPFFLENIQDYEMIVKPYVQALPDEIIEGDGEARNKRFTEDEQIPIFEGISQEFVEILFIDGAKSWRGMKHLLKVLCNKFIPGKTLLVCQDYKYWGAYWVPIMMSRIRKHVKPVHSTFNGSTVTFQLVSKIPNELIEGLEDHVMDMQADECLLEIEQASLLLSEWGDVLGAMNMLLCKVSFLSHQGEIGGAIEEFVEIQKSWPISLNLEQLERAREYLQNESAEDIARPIKLQLPYSGRRLLKVLGRIKRFLVR